MSSIYPLLAKTLSGFENILAKELKQLGAKEIQTGVRLVRFKGDLGFIYKANLALRTAIRILKPIRSFTISSQQELYDCLYRIPWSHFLDKEGSMAIRATVNSPLFSNSMYAVQRAKDAIVDQFRSETGLRPSINLSDPDFYLDLHIDQNQCTVSLDSSGKSLHKRGYKTEICEAPINEVLAAGLLLLSDWKGQCDFLDPMCGSGTFLIEAAMIACNIPPNLMRGFAFEKWSDWDLDLFEAVESSLMKKTREFQFDITGYDLSNSSVKKAIINIKNAHLEDYISVQSRDFFTTKKPSNNKLHLVSNPPYGERMSLNNLVAFYNRLGRTLKHGYANSEAWFIVSNLETLKHMELRTSKRIKVFNSNLEARFVKYEIYEGSRKRKKEIHNWPLFNDLSSCR